MDYSNDQLKYGESNNAYNMRFNVRGNVDMTLASWLKATTNAAVVFTNQYAGRGNFWGTASTLRPNWFAPLLPIDMMDTSVAQIQEYITNSNHLIDGKYLLGGTSSDMTNPFADLLAAGYVKEKARMFMFDVSLAADLGSLLKGLTFKTSYSVDYTSYYSEAFSETYAVYEPTWSQVNGKDMIIALKKHNEDKKDPNEYVGKSTYDQTMTFSAQFDYARTFAKYHNVAATFIGWGYQTQNSADENHESSDYHRTSNVNLGLRASYNYNHKYYADFSGAVIHSAKLPEGKRNAFSPSVTLGWRISKEKFMEASKIDQLKLRATYGHTGNGIDNAGYFSYLKRYNEDGGFWYSNGTSMSNGGSVSEISPLANTLLTWEKGRKVNVGLDLTLLKNRLTLSADYYNDYYYDILQSRGKSIQLLGIAYPAENIGKTRYSGLETQLSWQDHIGKVNYYVSANWSMEQNKRLFMDEQYVPYDYLKMTGQPTGTIYGLVATGFLTAKDIADGYPVMNGFNNIQAGDVKYKDMNGDGEINEFDRTVIGGDKPTCYFGIDLGFEWKGLEVTALIQGAYNRDLYNSDRTLLEGFQVIGQSYGQAYTNLLNRWTPETAETATYPRLTAGGNMYNYGNNWNSSLFVQNGNYIRLKNATVSYKLPENFCRNYLGGLRVKIFVQGQNLLTWSRTRLQDPEVTFTSYPLQRTITTGINLNF